MLTKTSDNSMDLFEARKCNVYDDKSVCSPVDAKRLVSGIHRTTGQSDRWLGFAVAHGSGSVTSGGLDAHYLTTL